MKENIDINSLFLGAKAENAKFFEELLLESFNDHNYWRRSYQPQDPTMQVEKTDTFDKFKSHFYELLARLKKSVPCHSQRYLGHMVSDILMPGMIGYFSTMLYNPNNVCFEASPVTSPLEVEVGKDLARLMGFKEEKSWAHLTSGGTVANIEALWVIRNLKYLPLIAVDIAKKHNAKISLNLPNGDKVLLSEVEDEYQLMSLSPKNLSKLAIEFFEYDWGFDIENEVHMHEKNISHAGMKDTLDGKVLIPATKHYSWPKAAEILGIGRENIEHVNVDENFRMCPKHLKEVLTRLHNEKTPVIAVIGILGSTECASVDPIDKIVELRKWYEKECNASFYLHIDGAYGGYARSMFINEEGEFKASENSPKEVSSAYEAVKKADSVTIDPHKLGYIPFSVGAVVYKDRSVKSATRCKAPYINNSTKTEDEDAYIGSYILEGSKSGAAAAACWLSHRVVPLDTNGYGRIINEPVKSANLLYKLLEKKKNLKLNVENKEYEVQIELLNKPDLDILLYVFNIKGNSSLEKMNLFNEKILEELSFDTNKNLNAHDYIISTTDFYHETYKDSVNDSLKSLSINIDDWQKNVKIIKVLRSSVVTPLVNTLELQDYFWEGFSGTLDKVLAKVIKENKELL